MFGGGILVYVKCVVFDFYSRTTLTIDYCTSTLCLVIVFVDLIDVHTHYTSPVLPFTSPYARTNRPTTPPAPPPVQPRLLAT